MSIDRMNPRDSLGFLTWKVARLMTNDMAARFAAQGIDVTVEQWRALIPIVKKKRLTQGQLCEALSQEKTGVSRLVAALEKRKLIIRESGVDDRRVKYLIATEAGQDLIERTIELALVSRTEAVRGIDPDELAICQKVLWQIIEPTLDGDGCMPE